MEICGQREYELLEKIGFTRVAGSAEELKAAEILKEECEKIGFPAVIEDFKIEDAEIETAKFEIVEPFQQEIPVTGFKCAPNTPDEGLTADFLYIENGTDVNLADAAGKIVLVNGFLRLPVYRKLMKAGAAAIVTMEGELRDKRDETDLSTRTLRETLRAFGSVPMVNMRVLDAIELVRKGASKAKLTLKNTVVERTSHNVVCTVPGTEKPEEIVSFGAHYDSVPFSKGVYDNGAGSVIIMEMLRYFKENPPVRTVKFMWYGAEEIGLEGSKAYVRDHKEELDKHLFMINVDVGGPVLGYETLAVTGEESLKNYAEYLMKIVGHPIEVKQSIYSSDSIPYADNGIPAVNFSRNGAYGAAYIHNRFDTMSFLSADMLAKTSVGVLELGKAVINAKVFPIERKLPQNIIDDVDKYLYKKELAEAEEEKKKAEEEKA